jgi:hypothetical protein
MGTKMELVGFSPDVSQHHRFELDVLKFVQTAQFSQFRVKAAATKLPVFSIHGTVADDTVTGCESTTAIAIDSGLVPIDQVQKFLGHLHIATTQIYAETSLRALGDNYTRALGGKR